MGMCCSASVSTDRVLGGAKEKLTELELWDKEDFVRSYQSMKEDGKFFKTQDAEENTM